MWGVGGVVVGWWLSLVMCCMCVFCFRSFYVLFFVFPFVCVCFYLLLFPLFLLGVVVVVGVLN